MTSPLYTAEDVIINGVSFNRIDEDGNYWIIEDIDGWWGLPEPTVPDDTRPFQDDGSYFAVGRYEARQITVSGHIMPGPGDTGAANPAQSAALNAARARNLLNRALNIVRSTAIFQVNEYDQAKIAAVQLVARPLTKFNDIRNVLEFNFQLRAPDPRKYAVDETIVDTSLQTEAAGYTFPMTFDYTFGAHGTAGLVSIVNSGSYDTYGVLTVRGPIIHPSIEHVEMGRTVSIDMSLSADEFLEINLKTKTILLNGTESRRNKLDAGSEWFFFQPGESTLRFTGYQITPGPETANLAIMLRSAWIE